MHAEALLKKAGFVRGAQHLGIIVRLIGISSALSGIVALPVTRTHIKPYVSAAAELMRAATSQ